MKSRFSTALNETAPPEVVELYPSALNAERPAEGAPEWVELIRPGRDVKGRDGREWINDRPVEIVSAICIGIWFNLECPASSAAARQMPPLSSTILKQFRTKNGLLNNFKQFYELA